MVDLTAEFQRQECRSVPITAPSVATRSEWINQLSGLSKTIARIRQQLPLPDVTYRDSATLRFSKSNEHNIALARCFDGLESKGAELATLTRLLNRLTSGRATQTYGT